MQNKRSTILLGFVLVVLMFTNSFSQNGAAVLYDISGSMQFRAGWKAIADETVLNILFGGGINSQYWVISSSDDAFLNRIQQGQPLLHPNSFLLFLKFGVINKRDGYPYFNEPIYEKVTDLQQSKHRLRSLFPKTFTDAWTHKELAKAVVRDYMIKQGNLNRWYLILLSDLKEDRPSVPPEADSLATSYRTTVNDTPAKLTLSYRPDNRLKLIVQDVRFIPKPQHQQKLGPGARVVLIKPCGGMKVNPKGNPIALNWRPLPDIKRYVARIFKDNTLVDQIQSTRNSAEITKALAPGNYQWEVTAFRTQGGTVKSNRERFIISSGGCGFLGWVFFIVILLIVASVVINILGKKQKRVER